MKVGIIKSGDDIGKTHYRGTTFGISEKDLQNLYDIMS